MIVDVRCVESEFFVRARCFMDKAPLLPTQGGPQRSFPKIPSSSSSSQGRRKGEEESDAALDFPVACPCHVYPGSTTLHNRCFRVFGVCASLDSRYCYCILYVVGLVCLLPPPYYVR